MEPKPEGRAGKGNACQLALTSSFLSTAPAGDRGLQPSSPSLQPRPASSVSLPVGHLGRISLLSYKPKGGGFSRVVTVYAFAKCLVFQLLKIKNIKAFGSFCQLSGPSYYMGQFLDRGQIFLYLHHLLPWIPGPFCVGMKTRLSNLS